MRGQHRGASWATWWATHITTRLEGHWTFTAAVPAAAVSHVAALCRLVSVCRPATGLVFLIDSITCKNHSA